MLVGATEVYSMRNWAFEAGWALRFNQCTKHDNA